MWGPHSPFCKLRDIHLYFELGHQLLSGSDGGLFHRGYRCGWAELIDQSGQTWQDMGVQVCVDIAAELGWCRSSCKQLLSLPPLHELRREANETGRNVASPVPRTFRINESKRVIYSCTMFECLISNIVIVVDATSRRQARACPSHFGSQGEMLGDHVVSFVPKSRANDRS